MIEISALLSTTAAALAALLILARQRASENEPVPSPIPVCNDEVGRGGRA